MKKFITASISLITAGAMALAALSGCSKKKDDEITELSATPVEYSSDGAYTTEVTGADFSGISQDDVKVYYAVFDDEAYQADLPDAELGEEVTENTPVEDEKGITVIEESAPDEDEIDSSDYYKDKQAQITAFSQNGSTMTVSFTDPDAATNRTYAYSVVIESKKMLAGVNVEFEQYALTPASDVKVLSTDTTFQITLELNGEFADTVEKEDVSLQGSFKNLTIDSVSSAKSLKPQVPPRLHCPSCL